MDLVVDPLGLPHVREHVCRRASPSRLGDGHDVGEVFLALGVVGAQAGQGFAQQDRVEGIDPGVDLGDRALGLRGVFLLDDPGHGTVGITDDPAVTGRVGDPRRDDGDPDGRCFMGAQQVTQGVGGEQGHIAVGDDDGARQVGRQGRQSALDGPAGAFDLVLVGDEAVRVARFECAATRSRSWRTTTCRWSGSTPRAAAIAWWTRLRPPIMCRTLGVADFIRVPSPAARTMTAVGRV